MQELRHFREAQLLERAEKGAPRGSRRRDDLGKAEPLVVQVGHQATDSFGDLDIFDGHDVGALARSGILVYG